MVNKFNAKYHKTQAIKFSGVYSPVFCFWKSSLSIGVAEKNGRVVMENVSLIFSVEAALQSSKTCRIELAMPLSNTSPQWSHFNFIH
jgi:hypothetical protein